MSINLSESPIKTKNYHECSTQIKYFYQVVSQFNGGTSINITDRSHSTQTNIINQSNKLIKAQFHLKQLFHKRMRLALLRIKKRSLRTQMSERDVMGKQQYDRMMMEEGFIQLDYVFKSDAQKSKVMGFQFIKYTYKQYKRKKQKRLRTGLDLLNKFFRKKTKRQKQTSFNQIIKWAASRPNLNEYKLAFRSLDRIMLGCFNRLKKSAFQKILRHSANLITEKQVQTQRKRSSQHIYVIQPRSSSRKKSQTIFVKVPIVSQRVYLQQLNVSSTRRKHRRSSISFKISMKQQVKHLGCRYCEYYGKCKYCQILDKFQV